MGLDLRRGQWKRGTSENISGFCKYNHWARDCSQKQPLNAVKVVEGEEAVMQSCSLEILNVLQLVETFVWALEEPRPKIVEAMVKKAVVKGYLASRRKNQVRTLVGSL
ncbi:hypothetical protein AMTR_s00062p00206110 [Amborella trichopoda]|uniref:Uncharacterized protein n=1 Tax=Amborella trichopoda TaxID=13333 RepID=U5DE71_AMBTC|nr:hypothetical protein AMTR_s00062p00206110 [Amborella trichopoda]